MKNHESGDTKVPGQAFYVQKNMKKILNFNRTIFGDK